MTSLAAFVKARVRELLAHDGRHRAGRRRHVLDADEVTRLRELHDTADRYERGLFGPAEEALAEGLMRERAADFADHPDYRDEWQHESRRAT